MTIKTAVSNILLREVSQEEANNFALEEQSAIHAYLRYEAYSLNFKRGALVNWEDNNPLLENPEVYHDELNDYDEILFDPIMQQYFS